MSFETHTTLITKTIRRLRMVQGTNTQLYAEDAISDMLIETYEMVRATRWWDHITQWQTRQLDGTTGMVTAAFTGARERFRDIQGVYVNNNSRPLPQLDQFNNPYRLSGTSARYIEPLDSSTDPNGQYLFRVWPLTSTTTVDEPVRVRIRTDPLNLFTDPTVVVPFDATCLINGAAYKYAADDGTNPGAVASLQQTFMQRKQQLEEQHDSAVILLDPRIYSPTGQDQWIEEQ